MVISGGMPRQTGMPLQRESDRIRLQSCYWLL